MGCSVKSINLLPMFIALDSRFGGFLVSTSGRYTPYRRSWLISERTVERQEQKCCFTGSLGRRQILHIDIVINAMCILVSYPLFTMGFFHSWFSLIWSMPNMFTIDNSMPLQGFGNFTILTPIQYEIVIEHVTKYQNCDCPRHSVAIL